MSNEEKILSLLMEIKTKQDAMETAMGEMKTRIGGLEYEVKNIFKYLVERKEETDRKFEAINDKLDLLAVMQERIDEHEWEIRKIKKRQIS